MTGRTICVLTATRAEYGLFVPLLHAIEARDDLALQLVVTGTHLSDAFGHTVDAIEADGFAITRRLDILQSGDDAQAAADTMGAALSAFTRCFTDLEPDILVLLGDRYEILAAATAATLAGVAIAHVHGGELTEGAFDDAMRHAITKMAHLHFTAAEPYRRRIIQMGEDPAHVHTVGAPAADNLRALDFMSRADLEADLGRPLGTPLLIATYHPVTQEDDAGLAGVEALIAALEKHPDAAIVFTGINADPGRDVVTKAIRAFVERSGGRASLHTSLGSRRYLSLMKIADAVVGNSSSGVIEAPMMGTPTVNIGPRQAGRLRATSVIDCAETADAIEAALTKALGGRIDLAATNIFGDGYAGERIAECLAQADPHLLRRKTFHDIPPSLPASDTAVHIIAEAGVNHNGSLKTAKALVDAAAEAGADAVKFQSFKADSLVTATAAKAAYQADRTGTRESQRDMLRALELDEPAQRDLAVHCRAKGITFLSTPFDMVSLRFLTDDLKLETIKVGSGDLTNAPLLLEIARRSCRVILSTGMASMDEIEISLGVLAFGYTTTAGTPGRAAFARAFRSRAGQTALREKVTLLQCTTAYPAPPADLNLRAMDALSARFDLAVGFSDHSEGSAAALAAVARGARVIEKHLTLDRAMPGPDHAASMETDDFAALVAAIRNVGQALGDGIKRPLSNEFSNKTAARKSLVAAKPIGKGETFTTENLTVKRPETGVPAHEYFDWIGRRAARDFAADEMIS